MLRVVSLKVLRVVAACVCTSSYYTIMVDETKDVSNQEQVTVILRQVDNDFSVHEEFIG